MTGPTPKTQQPPIFKWDKALNPDFFTIPPEEDIHASKKIDFPVFQPTKEEMKAVPSLIHSLELFLKSEDGTRYKSKIGDLFKYLAQWIKKSWPTSCEGIDADIKRLHDQMNDPSRIEQNQLKEIIDEKISFYTQLPYVLYNIVEALRAKKFSEAYLKTVISPIKDELSHCVEGTFLRMINADLKLKEPQLLCKLMEVRRTIAQQVAGKLLKIKYPNQSGIREIHDVQELILLSRGELGLPLATEHDRYATSHHPTSEELNAFTKGMTTASTMYTITDVLISNINLTAFQELLYKISGDPDDPVIYALLAKDLEDELLVYGQDKEYSFCDLTTVTASKRQFKPDIKQRLQISVMQRLVNSHMFNLKEMENYYYNGDRIHVLSPPNQLLSFVITDKYERKPLTTYSSRMLSHWVS